MKLNELREKITNLDIKLMEIIKERFKLSKEIGIYKKENNLPILDKKREEILKNKYKKIYNEESYEYFLEIFETILKVSKDIQNE